MTATILETLVPFPTQPPPSPEEGEVLVNGHRYEWIEGEWVERPMGAEAGKIALRIMSRVETHAATHGQGHAFPSEAGYQIFPETPKRVCYPDGSYIRSGQLPDEKPPKGHIQVVPDLVLEVVSPNDLAYEVQQKIADYLRVGVRIVWVVFPHLRWILVYRAGNQTSLLAEKDDLKGEDVLPGFICKVADLFAGL